MQHQPQHQQQGHTPSQQHLHHSRPSSVVHQQHGQPPQPPQQPAYSNASHALPQNYQHGSQSSSNNNQENLPYYNHQSPYSTPGAASGYTSADTSEMMAAAQIPRPHHYPPMSSYHTPQSNSPASVPSPSQHDQHRSIYGPPPSQHLPQSMYYQSQPPHYQSMGPQHGASPYGQPQPNPSPYGQHAQHPHSMTSQPNMMMSHPAPQNHMAQHAAQHAQAGMTGSPRPKIEAQVPLPLQKQQNSPMTQPQHTQNGAPQLHSPGSQGPGGLNNPNAAPGPIPATTPLVVRQDGNGVQWIAFEYSRDRVKMEYTIRCDVESVNTEELAQEFKQENCVYPRACCAKDQYRGNRLMYETDCNRVGWALAQLNPSLRGKRGLIQRAVDSWRNSNQDPRLRSRRVRRMAKVNGRGKSSTPSQSAAHLPAPTAAPGMPQGPGSMPQSHAQPMGKPGMGHMAQPMHHHPGAHPDSNGPGADEVDLSQSPPSRSSEASDYISCCGPGGRGEHDYHQQSHQDVSGGNDVRHNQVFTGYGAQGYPASAHGPPMSHMAPHASKAARHEEREDDTGLFPDLAEAKKRKFILVDDHSRGSRLRVRVVLQGVDTNEIPDSFRKSSSVHPGSFFRREMQSPPPSATGSRFFPDDLTDDGLQETEGRAAGRGGVKRKAAEMVKVSMGDDQEGEVAIERTTKSQRQKEVKLNDLGYRMAWLNSRPFAGRTVFLQRALDCYRNKTRVAIESEFKDVQSVVPHFETRVGKRRWNEFSKRGDRQDDE